MSCILTPTFHAASRHVPGPPQLPCGRARFFPHVCGCLWLPSQWRQPAMLSAVPLCVSQPTCLSGADVVTSAEAEGTSSALGAI
eukprot:2922597-Prymnesium_polylepis.1